MILHPQALAVWGNIMMFPGCVGVLPRMFCDTNSIGDATEEWTACVDCMAPFLRNKKCRRLSSRWLDGRLHFA